MNGDLLDRIEHDLIDGMRRYEAHPRRSTLRRWTPARAPFRALAIAAVLTLATALSLTTVRLGRDEAPTPSALTPPPPGIAGRNWKPVTSGAPPGMTGASIEVFQLTLTARSWTTIPDTQLDGKHGQLRWSGDRMIVNADPPCQDTGVYHVEAAANRMTITAERDPCAQRRSLLERRWLALP